MSVDPHNTDLYADGFGPVEQPEPSSDGGVLEGSIPSVWAVRRSLMAPELMAAAEMCLDFVTEQMIDAGEDDQMSDLAHLELTRARWYVAQAEITRRNEVRRRLGAMNQPPNPLAKQPPMSGVMDFSEVGGPSGRAEQGVVELNPGHMGQAEQMITINPWPVGGQVEPRQTMDHTERRPGRPIRDNPQA